MKNKERVNTIFFLSRMRLIKRQVTCNMGKLSARKREPFSTVSLELGSKVFRTSDEEQFPGSEIEYLLKEVRYLQLF